MWLVWGPFLFLSGWASEVEIKIGEVDSYWWFWTDCCSGCVLASWSGCCGSCGVELCCHLWLTSIHVYIQSLRTHEFVLSKFYVNFSIIILDHMALDELLFRKKLIQIFCREHDGFGLIWFPVLRVMVYWTSCVLFFNLQFFPNSLAASRSGFHLSKTTNKIYSPGYFKSISKQVAKLSTYTYKIFLLIFNYQVTVPFVSSFLFVLM